MQQICTPDVLFLPGFLKKALIVASSSAFGLCLPLGARKKLGSSMRLRKPKLLLIMEKGVPVLIIIQCPAVCLLYEDEIIRGIASNDL